jgi:hypothetical protein
MNATPRSKALSRLDALAPQIAYHLFKLTCCVDTRSEFRDGWLKELNAWRGELSLLRKSKMKYGNYDVPLLMEHIFDHHCDDLAALSAWARADGLEVNAGVFSQLEAVVEKFCETCISGERFQPDKQDGIN